MDKQQENKLHNTDWEEEAYLLDADDFDDLTSIKSPSATDSEQAPAPAARRSRRYSVPLLVALIVTGILLSLSVFSYVGLKWYTYQHREELELSGEEAEAEPKIYTQSQMEDALETARSESDAALAETASASYTEGSAYGQGSLLENIKLALMGGAAAVEVLRPYYPDDIVWVSGGLYHFIPINKSLKLNDYNQENVVSENGVYTYVVDEQVVSYKGIDVSSHQGSIDWSKVAGDGVDFAIIRCLYRGYGSGKLVEDEYFKSNISKAIDNGIHVGVYVFTQAITDAEMLEEANTAIELVRPYADSIPIVIDVEKVAGEKPRMDSLSIEERTRLVKLFCDTVAEAGFQPYIYFNTEMSILNIDLTQLDDYPKWYASYATSMFYPYKYDIWQYSESGRVNGISTKVDLNLGFEKFW